MSHIFFETQQLTAVSKNLLCVVLYFDIFSYPLTAAEIFDRSSSKSKEEVLQQLEYLLEAGLIYRFGEFFSTRNNPLLVKRRIEGNTRALKYMKKARRISKMMGCFPFVRSVMLSGSISKMYMDEQSDIDYFIVTAPKRLWIARFFFVLFHKTLFLNRTRFFCYNYMISADHLTIARQNTYTAAEIVTLIPTYGSEGYREFLQENTWTRKFFPNFPIPVSENISEGTALIKRLLERIFSGSLGEQLDICLMKHTQRRWHKRQPPEMFADPEAFMSLKRHTAKGHTQDHYPRILKAYNDSIRNFERKHGFSLSPGVILHIDF
mgnify:CR=1 FL=1